MKDYIITTMTLSDLYSIKPIFNSDFDEFWNFNLLREELSSKFSKYFVLKYNSNVIGFYGIKIYDNNCDVMNIVIKKDFRSNGFGKILLDSLIDFSKELKLSTITLEVSNLNHHAISLYKSHRICHYQY